MLETRLLSSLSKVFADEELTDPAVAKGSCLRGEVFSFQLAYRSPVSVKGIEIEIESSLQRYIDVRVVGLVPAEFLGAHFDDDVLRTTPGLYPDPLYGLESGIDALPGQWRALWVRVRVPPRRVQGQHPIVFDSITAANSSAVSVLCWKSSPKRCRNNGSFIPVGSTLIASLLITAMPSGVRDIGGDSKSSYIVPSITGSTCC